MKFQSPAFYLERRFGVWVSNDGLESIVVSYDGERTSVDVQVKVQTMSDPVLLSQSASTDSRHQSRLALHRR